MEIPQIFVFVHSILFLFLIILRLIVIRSLWIRLMIIWNVWSSTQFQVFNYELFNEQQQLFLQQFQRFAFHIARTSQIPTKILKVAAVWLNARVTHIYSAEKRKQQKPKVMWKQKPEPTFFSRLGRNYFYYLKFDTWTKCEIIDSIILNCVHSILLVCLTNEKQKKKEKETRTKRTPLRSVLSQANKTCVKFSFPLI